MLRTVKFGGALTQASAREDYGAEDPRCVAVRHRLVEHMRAAEAREGGGLELADLGEHGGAGAAPGEEPEPEPRPEAS
jgi:hypothetical protein